MFLTEPGDIEFTLPAGQVILYRLIPDFPCYQLGTDCSLWSCWNNYGPSFTWKRMKTPIDLKSGYRVACLRRTSKAKHSCALHRLMLLTFVGPCPQGMEACHGDGNKLNNHLSNLRWDTHQGNMDERERQGSLPRGMRHGAAKLQDRDIPAIFALRRLDFKQSEIADLLGVTPSRVSEILGGKAWSHVRPA